MHCIFKAIVVFFIVCCAESSVFLKNYTSVEIKSITLRRSARHTINNDHILMKIKISGKSIDCEMWRGFTMRGRSKISTNSIFASYLNNRYIYTGRLLNKTNSFVYGFLNLTSNLFFGHIRIDQTEFHFDYGILVKPELQGKQIMYKSEDLSTNITYNKNSSCDTIKNSNLNVDSQFTEPIINSDKSKYYRTKRSSTPQTCQLEYIVSQNMTNFFLNRLHGYEKETFVNILVVYITTTTMMTQEVFDNIETKEILLTFPIIRIIVLTDKLCDNYKSIKRRSPFIEYCNNNNSNVDMNILMEKLLNMLDREDSKVKPCSTIFLNFPHHLTETLGLASTASIFTCAAKFQKKSGIYINSIDNKRTNNIFPATVLGMVITHELGHFLGARHDDTFKECSKYPITLNGKVFTMSSSFKGLAFVNRKFSECSINSMRGGVRFATLKGCFIVNSNPVTCNDGYLDKHEDCDCGSFAGSYRCTKCCSKNCLLKEDSQCSIFGDCGHLCNEATCTWTKPTASGQVCQMPPTECLYPKICNKENENCTPFTMREDGTPCANGTKYCKDGICSQPVCSTTCKKAVDKDKYKKYDTECLISCLVESKCVHNFKSESNLKSPFFKRIGSNCSKGFCVDGICRKFHPYLSKSSYLGNLIDPCCDSFTSLAPLVLGVGIFLLILMILTCIIGGLIFVWATRRYHFTFTLLMVKALQMRIEYSFWMSPFFFGRRGIRSKIHKIRHLVAKNSFTLRKSYLNADGEVFMLSTQEDTI